MAEDKRYIIRVKSESVLGTFLSVAMNLGIKIEHVYRRVFYGFSAPLTEEQFEIISADARVIAIEEATAVFCYARQDEAPWHLDRIDQRELPLSGSYTYSSDGTGVIAYVLDSGCVFYNENKTASDTANFDHIDFSGRVSPVNELDGVGIPKTGVAFDPIYNRLQATDPENGRLSSPRGFDHFGHGTHVAGIIGSDTYGVAKNVDIRTAKVLDIFGAGTTSDVIAGIEAILSDFANNNPSVLPAVCNMSLGTSAPSSPAPFGGFELAIEALVAAGVTVVVAAGNEGQDANNISPARMDSVITVGATSKVVDSNGVVIEDTIANFSNFGDTEDIIADDTFGFNDSVATNTGSALDMFAPGVRIVSTYKTNPTSTNTFSGTSMASPLVAGVAALVLENNPTLSPTDVLELMITNSVEDIITGVPVGTPNRMVFSTFVDHEIEWTTPAGDLGDYAEGYTLNPQVKVEAVGFSGQLITYSNQGGGLPIGITVNAATGVLEGVVGAVLLDTVYNFTIRASDSSGFVDRAFSLTILDSELPPRWVTASNLSTVDEGELLSIQFSATSQNFPQNPDITYDSIDPDTDGVIPLPYGWSITAEGLMTGDIPVVINNEHDIEFNIRAFDDSVFSDQLFSLTINQSSFTEPPLWQTSANLGSIVKYEPVALEVVATDADGNPRPITYHETFTSGDGSIFGVNNSLPLGLTLQNDGVITGAFTGLLTDGVLDNPTTFDNITTTFDNNTTLSDSDLAVFEFQIFAEDGSHVIGKIFTISIHNAAENEPVNWITPSHRIAIFDALVFSSVTVEATDIDSSPNDLIYTLVSGDIPLGMNLDNNTGEIFGVPENINDIEKLSIFGIEASDGLSKVVRTFSITVLRSNRQPVWITPMGALMQPINEGTLFSKQLEATDPNTNDALRYRVITIEPFEVQLDNNTTTFDGDTTTISDTIDLNSELPNDISLSLSGMLTGVINDINEDTTYEFTVRVDDSLSNIDYLFSDRTFSITVVDGALNTNISPLWVTPAGALPDGIENELYIYELLASDIDGPDPLKFILIAGNLPHGLTLNTDTGVISGYSNDLDVVDTTSLFIVRLFDGAKSVDRSFSIKIEDSAVPNLPPTWITEEGNLGSFDELISIVIAVRAIDPEGSNVTYFDVNSGLPDGLVITIDGIINGITPQVSSDQELEFTIEARDEEGGISERIFSITVNDVANIPPVWTTNSSLGSFLEGIFTPIVLTAIDPDSGPSTDLIYTDTSGSTTHLNNAPVGATIGLPPGLTVSASGILSGFSTVTIDTIFSFEVTVFDGSANVQQQFTITITDNAATSSELSSLNVRLTGNINKEFKNWNTSDLIYDVELFAADIEGFGRVVEPDVYVMNNIHSLNPTTIAESFNMHHKTFDSLIGMPTFAVVRDVNDNIIYEVVYVNIIDPQLGSSFDIIDDYSMRDDSLILSPKTVSQSFTHLRTELQVLPNSDELPSWMSAEQILGDSSSIIGYNPSLVLAYVKPGFGDIIIDRLNTIETTTVITPASETTFDDTAVFGDEFSPVVSPGDTLTIKNGTAAMETVTFNAPGTLLQIVQDINDETIDGVHAAVRIIEQFIPDSPPATWPGTFQIGQVLVLTYDEKTIDLGGTALTILGLPAVGRETLWDDGTSFDASTGTEIIITKGLGYQLTGRNLIIDRYLFEDNSSAVTDLTSFDGATTTFDGNSTAFDLVFGVQKWIKFNSDIDNPVWITNKGVIGGFDTGDTVSIQLETVNDSGLTISYSLIYGALPDGLTLDSDGLISGTITGSLYTSIYFVVHAIDSDGNFSDRGFEIVVDGPTTFDTNLTTFTDLGVPMTLDVT